jgi:hypothetical protein
VIAAQPLTISEPVPGGTLVIRYAMQKPARRAMRSPFPPAWPWQTEPETALLLAFVDIVSAHAGDVPAMIALYASALRRLEAREQGKLSVADRKRDGEPIFVMTDELRALFGQPDPVRALIGYRDTASDEWVNGLAALTESERDAYWLHLHGLSRASIALALVPARVARFGRAAALPLDTVSKYLWRARVKLRQVFDRQPETQAEYLLALDAEEERAALELRDVDPAAAAAADVARERRLLAWPARWEERDLEAQPLRVADEENPEGEPWLP